MKLQTTDVYKRQLYSFYSMSLTVLKYLSEFTFSTDFHSKNYVNESFILANSQHFSFFYIYLYSSLLWYPLL